jgi:uncharacterized protein YceH (UPF0502 family)
MANSLPTLSLLEARVLGTLIEKQHTVPEAYPLTQFRAVLQVPSQAAALLTVLMPTGWTASSLP